MAHLSNCAPLQSSRSLQSPRTISGYPQMGVNFAKLNKKVKNAVMPSCGQSSDMPPLMGQAISPAIRQLSPGSIPPRIPSQPQSQTP